MSPEPLPPDITAIFTAKKENRYGNFLDIAICLLLGVTAVFFIIFILPVLESRLFYTAPLEHQEEVFLNTLRFFAEGGNIYQQPDLHFAGTIYPPFYFFAAGLFTDAFGLSFTSLRVLSLLSILGAAICVYVMIEALTKNKWAAAAWLPLYFAAWPLYGWIDLGRLEALFMFLIIAGACLCLKAGERCWMYALGGCLLGCAAATKQTGLIFLPALAFLPLLARRAIAAPLAAFGAAAFIYGTGFALFGGEMFTWLFALPAHQPREYDVGFNILIMWFVWYMGIAALLAFFAFSIFREVIIEKTLPCADIAIFAATVLLGCAAAIPPMFKLGAGPISLALFNAFTVLGASYAVGRALCSRMPAKAVCAAALCGVTIAALCLIGNGMLKERTPTAEGELDYHNLITFVHDARGEVWVTSHPWLTTLAGKQPCVPLQQLGGDWAYGMPGGHLPVDLTAAIRQHRFSMIVLGQEYVEAAMLRELKSELEANYRYAGDLPPDTGVARVDMISLPPTMIWMPK